MAELINAVWGGLLEFTQSDLGPDPASLWFVWSAVQMAHILIGATLALYRAPLLLVKAVFFLWVTKELLGDISNGGGAWLVVADSGADLCFGVLGYITAKLKMEEIRNGQR